MMKRVFTQLFVFFLFLLFSSYLLAETSTKSTWIAVGPDGGDVRSLAYDPNHPNRILLGTSAGQIYLSEDGGDTWSRYARIGQGNDYVVDHILFDPSRPGTIYVAAWTLEHEGGAVFKSSDDGHTWKSLQAMDGKSVRSLAMAESDPGTLVAGALDGVFRTRDGGQSWDRISPESSSEIKNIESIAIDPKDPEVVYAGTWHLPWKTSDGGRTWHNTKRGVIDDSDVFSIIIDPVQPQIVYASACSGIYKSENAGEIFHKIQGIPFSARRTRVLKQDPNNLNVVYAGTTEGLWKTTDAGRTWLRMTATNVIVNDVLVDRLNSEHVLLATDRSGVLTSNNGALSFHSSNRGFAHRQVAALLVDADESTLYAGLVNDKEYGGVFVSHDQGAHWTQLSAGLGGRDVFSLRKAGTQLLAGTSNGVFELQKSGKEEFWRPINSLVDEKLQVLRPATRRQKALVRRSVKTSVLSARVTDLQVHEGRWFAASAAGLFTSTNLGKSWEGGPVLGRRDFLLVRASSKWMTAAGRNFLLASVDRGNSWYEAKLPPIITSIADVSFAAGGSLWMATREGLYRSPDGGDTWDRILTLPVVNLASVSYDSDGKRMLVTAMNSTEIFWSGDNGHSWQHSDSAWLLRFIQQNAGHLIASTAFDGVVIESPGESSRAALPTVNTGTR